MESVEPVCLVVVAGGSPGWRDVVLGGVGAIVVAQLHLLEVEILPRDDRLLHLAALEALHAIMGAPKEADAGKRLHVEAQLLSDADREREQSVQRRRQLKSGVAWRRRQRLLRVGVHGGAAGASRRRVRAAGLESVERTLRRRRQRSPTVHFLVVLLLVALAPLLGVARHLKQSDKPIRPLITV